MAGITIDRLDHIVFTVADIEATCRFYSRVFDMEPVRFDDERVALIFGQQKINLHSLVNNYDPKAERPIPGSGDVCFITKTSIDEVVLHLEGQGVEVIEGPVKKTGALGPITSVYLYDPDGNLIEVSSYD